MTCDRFVGKVSAMGQPTRPTQPSIPDQWIMGWKPLNGRPGLYDCLVVGHSTAYRLYARSVCNTKAPLQLRYAVYGAI